MGSRADFYVGRGPLALWLGSIAWDGYPDGVPRAILRAKTEVGYMAAVTRFLAKRDDARLPKDGWPWPWGNSQTTDYAYAFDDDDVWCSPFGRGWHHATVDESKWVVDDSVPKVEFRDMSKIKNVTDGGFVLMVKRGP